jgi:hypothetical protein
MKYLISTFIYLSLTFNANLHADIPVQNTSSEHSDEEVYGHIEEILVVPGKIKLQARLDTGALRNSIHAEDIKHFKIDDEDWVSFTVDDHNGNLYKMKRPLIDTVTVQQASGAQDREVVTLGLCVGTVYKESRFTLADRSHMTYPVLVGRNFLKESVLVSSSDKLTAEPDCAFNKAK